MNYNGNIYRPPVEAETFLLPVTEGCSHNTCTFCNMYKDIPFRMLPLSEVEGGLKEVRAAYGKYADKIQRVYFVGADPFALSAKNLLERIALTKKYLPAAKVFTMYARTENVVKKSDEDLEKLKTAGVDDLYVGIECAKDDVLSYLNKGETAEMVRTQMNRLNKAKIHHSDLLMLGTAGKGRGKETALATAELENEIRPTQILVNTMSAFKGTKLDEDIKTGAFAQSSEKENLEEERTLLENLNLPDCYFWSLHPLDSVRIDGVLGKDKDEMLKVLDSAISHADDFAMQRTSRVGTL